MLNTVDGCKLFCFVNDTFFCIPAFWSRLRLLRRLSDRRFIRHECCPENKCKWRLTECIAPLIKPNKLSVDGVGDLVGELLVFYGISMCFLFNISIKRINGSPINVLGSSPSRRLNNAMPSPSDLKLPAQFSGDSLSI